MAAIITRSLLSRHPRKALLAAASTLGVMISPGICAPQPPIPNKSAVRVDRRTHLVLVGVLLLLSSIPTNAQVPSNEYLLRYLLE